MKKFIFYSIAMFFPLCMFLGLLEIVFRGIDYYEKKNHQGRAPRLENSMGLHDYEYSYSKGSDVYRILALGDSFVQGFTPIKDNWVKKLEGLLNANSNHVKFEVINGGREGTGAIQKSNRSRRNNYNLMSSTLPRRG